MDPLMIAVVASAITIGAATFYVGSGVVDARRSSSRRLASLQTRDEVLSTSISERAIAPIIEKLGKFALRFTPQGWVTKADRKLVHAGMSEKMDGNTWAAIRIVALIANKQFLWGMGISSGTGVRGTFQFNKRNFSDTGQRR